MTRWTQGIDYNHCIGQCQNIKILAVDDEYTPVIVVHKTNDCSSSFHAALAEGELLGDRSADYTLTPRENSFLESLLEDVAWWYDKVQGE